MSPPTHIRTYLNIYITRTYTSMTRKILTRLLPTIVTIVAGLIITTACSNDYKDMTAGEVRLRETDYRNDDKIESITILITSEGKTLDTDTLQMSALELRTLWHAVVIGAESDFENKSQTEKNTYNGPKEAEDAFYGCVEQNMLRLQEKYPTQYQAIVQEWSRADVHAFVHYMWCAMPDQYIKLKLYTTPFMSPTVPQSDATSIPSAEDDDRVPLPIVK